MRNGQKVIYNAGSMFTEAQWNTRKLEGAALREMFPEMVIGNPVDFDTNQTERPTNAAIFAMDYKELTEADYIIFEIDGWDSGTHVEFGLLLEQAMHNPNKYLLPIISDFRFKQGLLKGEIPGLGLNEMITGAFYAEKLNLGDVPQLTVVDSHESARNAIKAIETGDTKNFRQRFDIKEMYQNDGVYHGFDK
ncbi:nucleoside 2-deoxyribosyltransferase [[Acholeplasma] multilocale]|uniref:nucleoside 2-deoxyribosyltransferase n=1 Tax=[Acholeplasma] multilocale TaxID=264638 RepID=UPI00047CE6AF|nr:nucleoside 2-deoxyribosyltransferase [[Acholeplasma] multilocale]